MANIDRDGEAAIPRHEISLWAILATERLPLTPIYSDYGVIHPDFSDLTLSTHINGKIRYTASQHLYVFRGHSLRKLNKYEQYRTLAAKVIACEHYQGNSFSYGDRYIYDCATGYAGTGNPGTWVLVDQNHHISFVAQQMTRLVARVGAGARVNELFVNS